VDGRTYLLADGHFPSNVIRSTRRSRRNNTCVNCCMHIHWPTRWSISLPVSDCRHWMAII